MPTSTRPRLFLTSTMRTSFIEEDRRLLRERFELDEYIGSGIGAPWRVFAGAARAPVSVSWFASTYSFFMVLAARLRRGRCAIILGGVDTVGDVELGYGVWRTRWKRPLLRYAVAHADLLLAVDPSLGDSLARSSGLRDLNVSTVPTGYDPDFWTPGDVPPSADVLCVAAVQEMTRARVKGLDVLAAAAERVPHLRFLVVGVGEEVARQLSLPTNVTTLPPVPREQLRYYYRGARVYCQPSRYEGLPNALCEAMLCGCVPVGTRVGGTPNVIGNTGPITEPGDAESLAEAILAAAASTAAGSDAARERIASLFPVSARRERLLSEILGLYDA